MLGVICSLVHKLGVVVGLVQIEGTVIGLMQIDGSLGLCSFLQIVVIIGSLVQILGVTLTL